MLSKPAAAAAAIPAGLRSLVHRSPSSAAAARRIRRAGATNLPPPHAPDNPDTPRLPEPYTLSFTPCRVALHNQILTLIRSPSPDSLSEAAALCRHHVHSNLRAAVPTCSAVLRAFLNADRIPELFAFHRFLSQAATPFDISVHNIYLSALCRSGRLDDAVDFLGYISRDKAVVTPSPTTYRILVRALVDRGDLERAVKVKNDMISGGFVGADTKVYAMLMDGFLDAGDGKMVLNLYQEFKGKAGSGIIDGVIYGGLMKGQFLMGMESAAMQCYDKAMSSEKSNVRFGVGGYNSVLDACTKNGKLEEAVKLFDRMAQEHNPPLRLTLDRESFKVMVDAYFAAERHQDAIAVFERMREMGVDPNTDSYNNVIKHLGERSMVHKATCYYHEMGEKGAAPDVTTHVALMEGCFLVKNVDDGVNYFNKMIGDGLIPDSIAYHKIVLGLSELGMHEKAQDFFDQMCGKGLNPCAASYEVLLSAYIASKKWESAFKIAKRVMLDETVSASDALREAFLVAAQKEGMEDMVTTLHEDVERAKAAAEAQAAEERATKDALRLGERQRKKDKFEKDHGIGEVSKLFRQISNLQKESFAGSVADGVLPLPCEMSGNVDTFGSASNAHKGYPGSETAPHYCDISLPS